MKNINVFSRQVFLPLCLMAGLLGSALASHAATQYFLGVGSGSATRYWSVANNWSPNSSGGGNNVVPNFTTSPGDDLVFGTYASSQPSLKAFPTGTPTAGYYVNSITTTCNGWNFDHNQAQDKIILGPGGFNNNAGNVPSPSSGTPPAQNKFYTPIMLGASCTIYSGDLTNSLVFRTDAAGDNGAFSTSGQTNDLNLQNFTVTFDGPGAISFSAPLISGTSSYVGGSIVGTGGVIKKGLGLTSFSATNTYTGPTLVLAGRLNVTTLCAGGGSYTVGDNALLGVTVNSAGQTLSVSSLNLTNLTSTNSLQLTLGALGNPTAPVVHATNLILNGSVQVSIGGSGLSVGTIPLIQYDGSIQGGGTLTTNLLPTGVTAYFTNNIGAHQYQLVISQVPNLLWTGLSNAVTVGGWDIGGTSNWIDTSVSQPAYYANGLSVLFNDTAATKFVTLNTNVAPYLITVSNNVGTYTFTNNGNGSNYIGGTARIVKDGAGTLVLGTTNNYSGFTYIKNGLVQLAAPQAIGINSFVTNNGTLDLDGNGQHFTALYGSGLVENSGGSGADLILTATPGDSGTFTGHINDGPGASITLHKQTGVLTLSGNNSYSGGTIYEAGGAAAGRWIVVAGNNVLGSGPVTIAVSGTLTADASPRTVANTINDQVSFQFGNIGAGLLTCSGPIVFQGASADINTLTISNAVAFSGPLGAASGSTSGWGTKDGAGTLRLLNNTCSLQQLNADFQINDGSIILDDEAMSVVGATSPMVRVQSQVANGTASLYLTNNGSLTVGNVNGYYRLRVGDTSSPTNSLGKQCSTNIVEISGTLVADAITLGYSGQTVTTNNPGPSETYVTNWNGGGAYARLNMQPGSQATLNQIGFSPTKTVTEIYLDGATINANDGASSSFLQGLTNVFIKSGGLTLNGANTNSVHIRQNLLEGTPGGGGLTWNGTNNGMNGDSPQACILQLDGTNTYTGTTFIQVGTLGGIGTLTGPLVLASGSALYPGGGGNIGTVTVNGSVTMSNTAHCSFDLNITNSLLQTDGLTYTNYVLLSNTNDMLVVGGALNISGATLTVNNLGPALTNGNSFKLFSKAAVGFASVSLPALDPSLMWQTNLAVNGSITVVSTNSVVVTPPTLAVAQAGNVLTFSWSNGSGSFHLQSQTNAINVGITGTWTDYPGGASSPVPVTINPANATVFYRLSQ